MSIFKDTLKPFVASQLNARKSVVSTDANRDPKFLMYTTGKNSWVRMVSFVDAKIPIDPKNPKGGYRYEGQQLARKYVLEGGTLYNKQGTNDFSLRSGLLTPGSVYGSEIDRTYDISVNGKSNIVDRQFGLRPMPGISSASIISKSAYGSLREATVKFFCWDKHQLEELELLYMRTGYTVLLEWGWSEYLDHKVAGINDVPSDINIKTFDTPTIDPFKPGLTEDGVYTLIEKYNEKTNGNYDGMLGYIRNFSWQLMPNGGFECTTILISRGEVISTLKLSSNTDSRVTTLLPASDTGEPALTNFERIFYNIQAYLNQKETIDPNGSFVKAEKDKTNPAFITSQINASTATQQVNEINTTLKSTTFEAYDSASTVREPLGVGVLGAYVLADGNAEQGTGIEYIPLNTFIAIINTYFTLKNETNQTLIKILLPQGTPCLASKNSVSIDPTTCTIKNSKAKLITGNDKSKGFPVDGFNPKLYTFRGQTDTGAYIHQDVILNEFLLADGNGDIGNILVSIDKLVRLYKSTNQGQDGVLLIDYLQKLLDDISFALGGINDFKIFVDKNKAQIIDAKYLENGSKSARNTKYKFDLVGLKSICRDVKINSRIFESQSTMIAISAQARANIGDIYSSTQAYLNSGLTDRLKPGKAPTAADQLAYVKTLFNNIKNLQYYLNLKCSGKEGDNGIYKIIVPQSNEVQSASSLLKTFQLQVAGEDIDFKAIIPFELEIELDGIGGFVIGQLFTVDTSILPRDYSQKHVGFIITGISHELRSNDWVTRLRTQICLLDQDELKKENPNKDLQAKLLAALNDLRDLELKNSGVWDAYIDWLVYLTKEVIKNSGKDFNSATMTSIPNTYMNDSSVSKKNATAYEFLAGFNGAAPLGFRSYYKTIWYPKITTLIKNQAVKDRIIPPSEFEANNSVRIPAIVNNTEVKIPLTFDFEGVAYQGYGTKNVGGNFELDYNDANSDSGAGDVFLSRTNATKYPILPILKPDGSRFKLEFPTKAGKLDYQALYNIYYDWIRSFTVSKVDPSASPTAISPIDISVEAQ